MQTLNFSCRQIVLSLLGSERFCACLMQTKVLASLAFPKNISLVNSMATEYCSLIWSLSIFLLSFSATCPSRYLKTSTEYAFVN